MHDLKDLVTTNLDGLSLQDILDLIKDDTTVGDVKPLAVRFKLIKMLYNVLGYDLNKEILYIMASEPRAQFVNATAGAGKTTLNHLKLVLEKIIRKSVLLQAPLSGERILCLVYNTHNVDDMINKHKNLVTRLYASGIQGLEIDDKIKAYTMHGFCDMWTNTYAMECGLIGSTLLTEEEALSLMKNIITVICMKTGKNPDKINIKDTLSLYNYARETMVPYEELEKTDKFIDSGLDFEFVNVVFNQYDNLKSLKNKYDFTDMLYKFNNLLETNETVRQRIQDYYDYITVDEVQDFTTIMMRIVRNILGKNTPLLCIGDEDQSIYTFRGADIDNTLRFKEYFPGGEVYTLGINRRCGKEIVEAAKSVIAKNELRYKKTIRAKNSEGSVELRPYASKQGQLINISKDLVTMTHEELRETVICYRDRASSMAIASILEEKGIPFHILSGYNSFSHELFNHVSEVLDMLYFSTRQQEMCALYKCTPARKEQIFSAIGYNQRTKSFKPFMEIKNFYDVNYGELMKSKPFVDTLAYLKNISINMEKINMSEYFPQLFKLITKYFWNYKMNINKRPAIDGYFSDVVFKIFNVDMTYQMFRSYIAKRREKITYNQQTKNGVALSTLHGLKGLEYDNVYIIDLEESIFPNFALIESKGYPMETAIKLKEAETRLMYVGMTRARKKLVLYYDELNPSCYIDVIKEHKETAQKDLDLLNTFEPVVNKEVKNNFAPKVGSSMLNRFF